MTGEPDDDNARPKRLTRRRLAIVLCLAAVPAVWIGMRIADALDDGCGCANPNISTPPAP